MGSKVRPLFVYLFRNRSVAFFALVWVSGLLSGSIISALSGDSYFLLMHTAARSRVSIVGLVASVYLPFLFSAFAVFIGKPKLIYPVVFFKSLLLAHGAVGVSVAFASAGWLARFLLQFSDILMAPVFCWFLIRHFSGNTVLKRDLSLSTALFLLIGSVDYCVVSPFLVMLIDI